MEEKNTLPRGATSFYNFNDEQQPQIQPQEDDKPLGGNSSSSTTKTTTTVASNPYAQFKGNNYKDVEDFIRSRIDEYTPETKEEREKRERREKRTMFLANIANVLGDMHKAYSYQRGVAPMDVPDISAKARERFEKAKAEREKDADRMLNYAITLGKLKDADRDFNFKVTQTEQQQKNWQQQYDAGRQDRADDVEYRKKRAEAQDNQWQQQFDYTKEKDERNFKESVRQFNISSSIQRQGINLQAQRLQMERDNNSQTYTLGEGQGSVTVPRAAINSHNFSVVYNSLPSQYRTANGDPIYTFDALGNKVISGYGAPSAEAMAVAVGAYLGDQSIPADQKTATRTALSQLGKKTGGNDKTMPGVE